MTNHGETSMTNTETLTPSPQIGILCWEEGCVERGLLQLEKLPGSSNCPETFDFPLLYCRVKGANTHTILEKPCPNVLQTMIGEAKKMEEKGVLAITTSCGFNAILQRELADAVDIPVFTSSLLQVPFVSQMLKKGQSVGIITARKSALTETHLRNAGIEDNVSICIEGVDGSKEWDKMFSCPDEEVNITQIENEVVDVARSMMKQSNIGAFVLECTDLPQFANSIREATGRPVFDISTLIRNVYQGI